MTTAVGMTTYRRVAIASIVASAILGLANLQTPFWGDQALLSLVSRMVDDGAVLYRDIWDVKQPGIYAFYWLGGRLFSFSELGPHLLELIYLFASAWFIWHAIRDRYTTRWVAGLIPLATVGWYYAVAPVMHLTQVESLIGPLIFISVWLLWRGGTARTIGAGLAGGMVLYLKLIYAPLLLVLWVITLRNSDAKLREGLRALGQIAIGLLIAATPFLVWILANDMWDRVWFTFVTYPREVGTFSNRSLRRLVADSGQFAALYLPLGLLAIYAMWARRRDPLVKVLTTWIIAGTLTYLAQLWWGYYLQVLLIPIGLLALEGVDDLVSTPRRWHRGWIAVAALALLPTLFTVGTKALDLGQHSFGIGDSKHEWQAAAHPDYKRILADIDHLAAGTDPIYILGDPAYYVLSDRNQAPPVNGWSPEVWTDQLWVEIQEGIVAEQPEFILIDSHSCSVLLERSPSTVALIEATYDIFRPRDAVGTWYIRRLESSAPETNTTSFDSQGCAGQLPD